MVDFLDPFYNVTGGSTHRAEPDRWIDNGVMLPELGVDCTGATDTSSALQAVIDAVDDDTNLIAPLGSTIKLGSTINIVDRNGIQITSAARAVNGAVAAPTFNWTAAGGTMFNISASDHPAFKGFVFQGFGGGYADTYLKFDGERVSATPTLALVESCTFYESVANASHKAIQISPTANTNHENYQIIDCDLNGAGRTTTKRAADGVTNGTTTLTSATAVFAGGDVGKRIRVSYAGGMHDTTIASRTNATTVVLTDAAGFSQTGCTIHIGTAYGTGIYQAGSNAFHTKLINVRASGFAKGFDLTNGSFHIEHYGGGFNDVGITMGNANGVIDFYDAESDMRAAVITGNYPCLIRMMRLTTAEARADGWIDFNDGIARLHITGAHSEDSSFPTNARLFPSGGTAKIVSIGNYYWPLTRAQVNIANVGNAVWLNDVDATGISCGSAGLPTADPTSVGQWWNSSGALKISAG